MSPAATHPTTIPNNLRRQAARIVAGFADISLVADLLGLSPEEYRSYESDPHSEPESWHDLARVFGVTADYLLRGTVRGHREELAELVAVGLLRFRTERTGDKSPAAALRAARTSAGYESTSDAAVALGINPLLYLAQEQNARPLGADQVCFYALAFGLRPDQVLAGEKADVLWRGDDERWWRVQDRTQYDLPDVAPNPAFDWLQRGNSAGPILNLPVIEFIDDGWVKRSHRFRLPRTMLPAASGPVGDTLYAIVSRFVNGSQYVIADPTTVGLDSVIATGGGQLSVVHGRRAGKVVDPTHHRPRTKNMRFCVGSYVATTAAFG